MSSTSLERGGRPASARGWGRLHGCSATLTALPVFVLLAGSAWQVGALAFPHWVLVPASWLAWLALVAAADRAASPGAFSERVLAAWTRLDVPVAALLSYAVLFRFSADHLLASALIALLLVAALFGYRRAVLHIPAQALVIVLLVFSAAAVLAPRLFRAAVIAAVARSHDLTVDHRMKPDGGEINGDGVRFRGDASELERDDFVVLFLGDSFTFGWNLAYDASYPYVFESRVASWPCEAKVRAVNFGWTSSSPLLSVRLLREIGRRYSPDLVVYNLDMTDFHDDLRYEVMLRRAGDFEPDAARVVDRALRPWLPDWLEGGPGSTLLAAPWRGSEPSDWVAPAFPGPNDRFFVTAHPLDRTRDAIERGTMRHLAAIHRHTADVLGAEMVVVVYPRAYQYSMRESPQSWEEDRYERLGPHVREPFRYFEQRRAALPYPVISLLEDFRNAREFPLFMKKDPHWNEAGAAFAAERVARALEAEGLLPCAAPG